jgi:hypothetical protein
METPLRRFILGRRLVYIEEQCVRDSSGKRPAAGGDLERIARPEGNGSEKRSGSEPPRGARHNREQGVEIGNQIYREGIGVFRV